MAKRESVTAIIRTDPDPQTRRADWSEWSVERERKRVAANVAETARIVGTAIYPIEIAEQIADDAKKLVPDWRLLRPEIGGLFQRLITQQPEWRQPEIRQRAKLMTMIVDHLPRHIRPLLDDLKLIDELTMQAREASAFLVGHCTGRKAERMYLDARGRMRSGARGRGPARNRLHDGGTDAKAE